MKLEPFPDFLAGVRVAVVADRSTLVAGRLLADLGAHCLVVEPSEGHPLRVQPPFIDGVGATWWELTRGMETARGDLAALPLDTLDIAVVTAELPVVPERTVVVRISPFGPDGPWATWRGSELLVQAASGLLDLVGDADRPPVMIGGHPIESVAGAVAATGALIALLARDRTGRGQRVDVSQLAAAAWATHPTRPLWLLERQRTTRAGASRPFGTARRRLIFPCADGYVALQGVLGREWAAFVEWATEEGIDASVHDPVFAEAARRASVVPGGVEQAIVDRVDDLVARFLLRHTRRELADEGQRRRIIIFPVNEPSDLLVDRQLAARDYFQPVQTADGRTLRVPGPPVKVTPGSRVLSRLTHGSGAESSLVVALTSVRPLGHGPGARLSPLEDTNSVSPRAHASGGDAGPLAGLRVLDFSWVGAGPLTTLQLAVCGAEVIRVESALRPDVLRLSPPFVGGEPNLETSGYFFPLNASKRSVALNLATDEGRAVARRLATVCDIVVDSFTPRVMPGWGLDHVTLRRDRPDVIVLSLSMVGATGPDRDALGFGTVLQAAAGYPAVTGWPDRGPVAPGIPFTDWVAPFAVLPTLLAAVAHRQRTGEGCFLDASQLEATVALFREPVVASQCGDAPARSGNRLLAAGVDLAVPHGVYPCRGDDRWLALACLHDSEWARLAAVIGDPPVSASAPLEERRTARLAIDDWIARWSIEHDSEEAAALLQAAGVPAVPVRDVASAANDAQLRAWGFGTLLEHPVAGPTPYDPPPFRLADSPARLRPAPLLGADTEDVIRGLLGLSDDDWTQLVAAGVFL